MAMQSLIEAVRSLVTIPIVWLNGLFACMAILLSYYVYLNGGIIFGIVTAILLLLLYPFFLAGTYGVILDGNKKRGAFMIYARYGYTRCLFPTILIVFLTWLLMNVLTYILALAGVSAELSVYIGMFVVIPIVFFSYFADITAIRHNLRMGQAIKDSTRRVMGGSLSITAFYLMNVALFFTASFIFSMLFSVFGADSIMALTRLNETQLLSLMPDELMALVMTPEIIWAMTLALAVTALIFMPLIIAYKAFFFKRLLVIPVPSAQPAEDADGEYDEKGRWFKYK